MNRKFGVEIELKGIEKTVAQQAIAGVGIACEIENYNHVTRHDHWKIVPDSSVEDGFEIVSPVLSDSSGFEAVRKVSEALQRAGARIERDCGFHVHVDARDLNVQTLLKITQRYCNFEQSIDRFMPQSRRGNSNRYCQSPKRLVQLFSSIENNKAEM